MRCVVRMTISTIALDLHHPQKQPRNEPPYSRPRRSPRVRRAGGVSSIRSPRIILDVDLTVQPGGGGQSSTSARLHTKENLETEPELGTGSQTRERVLLTEVDQLTSLSKLSRPAWPKSSPTIPSTLYKNDFQTKVTITAAVAVFIYHYHH